MPRFGRPIRSIAGRMRLQLSLLFRPLTIALLVVTLSLPGCRTTWWEGHSEPIPEPCSDIELTEYREWATEVDYPVESCEQPPPNIPAFEPRRLRNFSKDDLWDITLEEAVHTALSQNDLIRSSSVFLSPGNPILANPDFAASVYDVAIQETGVLFGQRGVEAALSEFDTQFTTTMTWGRDEQIQNNLFSQGLQPGDTLTQETANFNATLQKPLATGGVFGVTHQWDYQWNNVSNQLFPSVYTGQLRAEFRQPLWAGAGTEYTRIAGPISQNIQGVTGVQQGVVIARINNDMTIADFEQSVTTLVRDVEELYWQLYLAYQQFDGESMLYQAALRNWYDVQARMQAQTAGGGALEAADARDQVLQIENRLDLARNRLYDVEAQLRRMMVLPPNDGRILRPIDEPIVAEITPDWHLMLSDALDHRVELRKQKWNIKRLELELKAAKHLVKPRLDFVSGYHVNGFGNDLLGNQSDGLTSQGLGSAYRTLTGGQQTGWNMGFEFSVPLGLRFSHAQVQNTEFKLTKARKALFDQELEISHELAAAFRQLESSYLTMQSGLNRKLTAEKRLRAVEVLRQATPDRVTPDAVLRAHDQYIQTQAAFAQAIVEYNIAVMNLHYRSGTLLGLDNVHLAEGPWTPEAYDDAIEKAACRTRTVPTATMLHSEPPAFAIPVGDEIPNSPPPEAVPAYPRGPQTEKTGPEPMEGPPGEIPTVHPLVEPPRLSPASETLPPPYFAPPINGSPGPGPQVQGNSATQSGSDAPAAVLRTASQAKAKPIANTSPEADVDALVQKWLNGLAE